MRITSASHLDHGLQPEHVAFIERRFAAYTDGFFIETFDLPADLPAVPCGLWGPLMGDPAVPDGEVALRVRGTRAGPSRLVRRAPRPVRTVTVIAGPHGSEPCVLYTAFGGPVAPPEPWEPRLTPSLAAESQAFWAEHALSE
jgi:hypothetical protein